MYPFTVYHTYIAVGKRYRRVSCPYRIFQKGRRNPASQPLQQGKAGEAASSFFLREHFQMELLQGICEAVLLPDFNRNPV